MKFNKSILKFQEGGPMPAEDPAAQGAPMGPEGAPEEGAAPAGGAEAQLQQIAGDLVNQLMQGIGDPQAVAAILQMALEMVSQAAQPQAPAYQRLGGKLTRIR